MFDIRLAGGHLSESWLFTWLSLVMSLMMSYFGFFPQDVLDEMLDLIESVPENYPIYFC